MRLFGCVCGQFHTTAADMGMRGGEARIQVPVPFYVMEHPDGVALFDCGLHAEVAGEDDPFRRGLRSAGFDITFGPDDILSRRLEQLDIDPAQVRWVVLSHLHFDHAGGLHQLPNATVVVQHREWEAGMDRDMAARYFLRRRFFDLGHPVQLIDGEHDLFGDGSAVCVPSFGHTPGHQSLRVRSAEGDHILVGDACYTCEAAESRAFPQFADHAAMNQSLDRLLALRAPETVMVFGHDPGQWGERPVLPGKRG